MTSRSFAQRRKKALILIFVSIYTFVWPANVVLADGIVVKEGTGNTNHYTAPNGVPVVDIKTPTSQGLSHNKYSEFNVDSKGAVLNNSAAIVQSQLAGAILANENLTAGQEAQVILNEVVDANRSNLQGYLEVNGVKADVVVANPYGIYTNGAGFINADKVTLTTGTPTVTNGALQGFDVTQGLLEVDGEGIDAEDSEILDLIARNMTVNGQINAKSLRLTAGSSTIDYDTGAATSNGASDKTAYSIDSTALGGMYANKITIVSTDAGFGVKMAGDMAASTDDVTITSAGDILLQNKVTAADEISVEYTGDDADGKITVSSTDKGLTADGNLTLTSTKAIELENAALKAKNNLAITAATVTDSGTSANTRAADNNVTITTSGAFTASATSYIAGNALSATLGEMDVTGDAVFAAGTDDTKSDKTLTMTTTSGNLDVGTADIQSSTDITLASAANLVIDGNSNQTVTAGDDIHVRTAGELTNAGKLLASTDLNITGTGASDVTHTNTGTMQAGNDINYAGDHVDLSNEGSGKLLAKKNIDMDLNSVTVTTSAAVQADDIDVSGALTNDGTVIVTTNYATDGAVTANRIINESNGTIQGIQDLTLNANSSVGNAGNLLAPEDIKIESTATGSDLTVTNSGTIQGENIEITGKSQDGAVDVTNEAGGVVFARSDLTLKNDTLTNAGSMKGAAVTTVEVDGLLDNSGSLILSDDTTQVSTVTAGLLTNQSGGVIQNQNALTLAVTGAITNAGSMIATNNLNLNQSSASLTNSGVLESEAADVVIDISGDVENQSGGKILAKSGVFTLNAGGDITNAGHIEGETTSTGKDIDASGTFTHSGTLLSTSTTDKLWIEAASLDISGNITSNSALDVDGTAASMTDSGEISTDGVLTIDLATFSNDGDIYALDDITITPTATFTNSANGDIYSEKGVTLSSGAMAGTNAGTIVADEEITFNGASLNNSGTLDSTLALLVTTSGRTTNSGEMVSAAAMTLDTAEFVNSGKIKSTDDFQVNVSSATDGHFDNAGTGEIASDGDVYLYTDAYVKNAGLIKSGGTLTAKKADTTSILSDFQNLAGGEYLAQTFDLDTTEFTNAGWMQADVDGTIDVTNGLDNASTGTIYLAASSGTGEISGRDIDNYGTIKSTGPLSFTIEDGQTFINRSGAKILGASGTGNITIQAEGSGDSITVNNAGRMDAEDLTLKTYGSEKEMSLNNSGVIKANDTLSITADGITNSDTIQGETVSISTNTFTNSGAGSLLLFSGSSGSSSLNPTTSTVNQGAIHSNSNFTLTTPSLSNSGTAAISSLGDLTLTGLTSNFTNYGLLYAGDDLSVSIPSHNMTNASGGTINTGDDLTVNAGSFYNYYDINSGGDISITVNNGDFINRYTGTTVDDEYVTYYGGWSFSDFLEFSGRDEMEWQWFPGFGTGHWGTGEPNLHWREVFDRHSGTYQDELLYDRYEATFPSAWGDDGDNDAWTHSWIGANDSLEMVGHADYWSYFEYFWYSDAPQYGDHYSHRVAAGYKNIRKLNYIHNPDNARNSKIVADGNITINLNNNDGYNEGSVISAGENLTINGGATADFTNDAITQQTEIRRLFYGFLGSNVPGQESDFRLLTGNDIYWYNSWDDRDDAWAYEDEDDTNPDWPGDSDPTTLSEARGAVIDNIPADTTQDNNSYYYRKYQGGGDPSIGGGMSAGGTMSINIGGTLTNDGSSVSRPASVSGNSESGAGSTSFGSGSASTSSASGASGTTVTAAPSQSGATRTTVASNVELVNSMVFLGLDLTLPTNPSGLFVLSQDPNSSYLIETNPRFGLDAPYLGSDFLTDRLLNDGRLAPDDTLRRLGDAAYENQLIQDQLVAQAGTALMGNYDTIQEQTRALYTNAAQAAGDLDLAYGQPLTAEQQAGLDKDMVWMVSRNIGGNQVVVPVVYLANATIENILTNGTAIASKEDMTIRAGSLVNKDGTISSDEDLSVTAEGDIENEDGRLAGKNVDLEGERLTNVDGDITASDEGEVAVKTRREISNIGGNIQGGAVDLKGERLTNKEGTIKSSDDGALAVKTRGDITNISGRIEGGDVDIAATDGSIVNRTTTKRVGDLEDRYTTDIGETATIKSKRSLSLSAGKDIVNKGADVTAGTDAKLKAGRDVVFDTIQDETSTRNKTYGSSTHKSGDTTTTTHTKTTTVHRTTKQIGSGLKVGGNLNMSAGRDLTIAGSEVEAGKSASLSAGRNQNIIARDDVDETTTNVQSHSTSVTKEKSGNWLTGKKTKTTVQTSSSNTTSVDTKTKARASVIKVGGNLNRSTRETQTDEGTDITVGGNYTEKAKTIVNKAARDTHSNDTVSHVSTRTESTEKGTGALYTSAHAEKKTTTENVTTATSSRESTARAGKIKVGGNMLSQTTDSTTYEGTQVEARGDVTIQSKSFSHEAAYDTSDRTLSQVSDKHTNTKHTDAGLTANGIEANASRTVTDTTTSVNEAESSATAKVGRIKGGSVNLDTSGATVLEGTTVSAGEGGVNVKAESFDYKAAQDRHAKTRTTSVQTKEDKTSVNVTVGKGKGGGVAVGAKVGHKHTETTTDEASAEKSTRAVVGNLDSTGNITIDTSKKTTLEGTQIRSDGDMDVQAGSFEYQAAEDTYEQTASKDSSSWNVGADASVGVNFKKGKKPKAAATVGVEGGFARSEESSFEEGTTAVKGSMDLGGGLNVSTRKDITFEGTDVTAKGAEIRSQSGKVDFKAARDTHETGASTKKYGAQGRVEGGVGAKGGVVANVKASGNYSESESGSETTTAQAGSMNLGDGGLNISGNRDVTFEGTTIETTGGANIASKEGGVNFKAARDTEKTHASGFGFSGEMEAGTSGVSMSAEGHYNNQSTEKSTAKAGFIKSGDGGLAVSGKQKVTFEGTALETTGDAAVSSKQGSVEFNAAKSTETSTGLSLSGGGSFGSSGGMGMSADVQAHDLDASTEQAGALKAGGNVTVNAGKTAKFVGTDVAAGKEIDVQGKEGIDIQATTNKKRSLSGGVSVEYSGGSGSSPAKKGKSSTNVGVNMAGEDSVTQKAATFRSGGGTGMKTDGDINMEGTQIQAGGDVDLEAEGDVDFEATMNRTMKAGVGGSMGDGGTSVDNVDAGFSRSRQGVNISSGGKIEAKAGGRMKEEGTQFDAAGGTDIETAGGRSRTELAPDVDVGGAYSKENGVSGNVRVGDHKVSSSTESLSSGGGF